MLDANLRSMGAMARPGGEFDRWDIQIRGGLFSRVRLRLAVEEHGAGKQLLRWRIWPHLSPWILAIAAVLAALALGAALDGAAIAAGILGGCVLLMLLRVAVECSRAMGSARAALEDLK